MNLMRIEGPQDVMLGITDIPDLGVLGRQAVQLPNGNWAVSAYASDAAVATLQVRGCAVDIAQTDQQVQDGNQLALNDVGGEPPIV